MRPFRTRDPTRVLCQPPFGVDVATINPGFYGTGFNDRGVDSVMHWYDPVLRLGSNERA